MVQGRVDVVRADGVDSEILHECCIAQTDLRVGERVAAVGSVTSLAAGLIVDSEDHEAVASLGVDELLLVDLNGVQSEGEGAK